jgi:hydrogenase maturation protein HypF
MTGICIYSSFHAEAPMRLEDILDETEKGQYGFSIDKTINPGMMIREIVRDLLSKLPISAISAKFHNTVVNMILQSVKKVNQETGIKKVVLSGGTFQNRYILKYSEMELAKAGFQVFSHSAIPSNDGGIALGQLIIAARRRNIGLV